MDEIRSEIWDFLFHNGGKQSVETTAQSLNRDVETVQRAVDHCWFHVADGQISVA